MLAFANSIPSYRKGEATIDLMRRRSHGPNGTMDYLLLKLFLKSKEQGFTRFSLGMAPMSGFTRGEAVTAEERAARFFLLKMKFLFSFRRSYSIQGKIRLELGAALSDLPQSSRASERGIGYRESLASTEKERRRHLDNKSREQGTLAA